MMNIIHNIFRVVINIILLMIFRVTFTDDVSEIPISSAESSPQTPPSSGMNKMISSGHL